MICPCGKPCYCNKGMCWDCLYQHMMQSIAEEAKMLVATDLQTHLMLQSCETRMQYKTRRLVGRLCKGK